MRYVSSVRRLLRSSLASKATWAETAASIGRAFSQEFPGRDLDPHDKLEAKDRLPDR